MCGIAGFVDVRGHAGSPDVTLRRMLAAIRHRGPDEFGVYLDSQVALGNAGLSIVDLEGGQQSFATEDERFWILVNGGFLTMLNLEQNWNVAGRDLNLSVIQRSF